MPDPPMRFLMGNMRIYTAGLESDPQDRYIYGYAIRYDDLHKRIDGYTERFVPDSITFEKKVLLNVGHDHSRVLGVYPGTMKLESDKNGIHLEAKILDTQEGRDMLTNVKAGVLSGLSVEVFNLKGYRKGNDITWNSARMSGVAIVAYPAFEKTDISTRDIFGSLEDLDNAHVKTPIIRRSHVWMV